MQLPPLPQDGEATARAIIRRAIAEAQPVTEPDPDDPDTNPPIPLGINRAEILVPGPDFAVTWRWVIDFSYTLSVFSGDGIPERHDLVFENKRITISFAFSTNAVTVEFATPESTS